MNEDIKHDQDKRFYIDIDGKVAELSYHKIDNKTLDLYRTFVPESLRNRGIASRLTEFALEYAKKQNYFVIPTCPYIEQFILSHPGYKELIDVKKDV